MATKGKELTDPISKQVYSLTDGGLVQVFDPATGETGFFESDGHWVSGELRYANRQLLGWVGRLALKSE